MALRRSHLGWGDRCQDVLGLLFWLARGDIVGLRAQPVLQSACANGTARLALSLCSKLCLQLFRKNFDFLHGGGLFDSMLDDGDPRLVLLALPHEMIQ